MTVIRKIQIYASLHIRYMNFILYLIIRRRTRRKTNLPYKLRAQSPRTSRARFPSRCQRRRDATTAAALTAAIKISRRRTSPLAR